jgi:hypothetical protein
MPINYKQKKLDLEHWFRCHDETNQFWAANREEYNRTIEILNKQQNGAIN